MALALDPVFCISCPQYRFTQQSSLLAAFSTRSEWRNFTFLLICTPSPNSLYSFPVCIPPAHHVPLSLKTASIPNVGSASPYTAFSTNYFSTYISPKDCFMPTICSTLKLPLQSTKLQEVIRNHHLCSVCAQDLRRRKEIEP